MTASEVGDYLDCDYSTLYRLIHNGGFPVFKADRALKTETGYAGAAQLLDSDRQVRWRSDLEKWIAERQAEPYALGKHRNRGRKPKS